MTQTWGVRILNSTTNGETSLKMAKVDKEQDMKIKILREIASSGGLAQNRVSLEVLYLLPTEFIEAYTTLFFNALREDAKGTNLEIRAGEITDKSLARKKKPKAGVESKGPVNLGHGEGSKRYRNAWTIRSERALALKSTIDRRLLELSVDINSGLKEGEGGKVKAKARKCKGAGCGKYVKVEWRYCPSCGHSSSGRKDIDK